MSQGLNVSDPPLGRMAVTCCSGGLPEQGQDVPATDGLPLRQAQERQGVEHFHCLRKGHAPQARAEVRAPEQSLRPESLQQRLDIRPGGTVRIVVRWVADGVEAAEFDAWPGPGG